MNPPTTDAPTGHLRSDSAPALPRVLLLEDDPISHAVLRAALLTMPAQVDSADTVAGALALALAHDHALWMFDANLPDGSGAGLLGTLRRMQRNNPALAHTATSEVDVLDALIDAGFLEVLVKPLSAAAIQGAVRRALGLPEIDAADIAGNQAAGKLPVWDDAMAARALNGNRAHIATLRALFIDELPRLRRDVGSATRDGDLQTLRAVLHKLRASCGFVGAARLGEAARTLHQQAHSPALRTRFDDAAQDTLDTSAIVSARHGEAQEGEPSGDAPVSASG